MIAGLMHASATPVINLCFLAQATFTGTASAARSYIRFFSIAIELL
jgi:hypothetical protein